MRALALGLVVSLSAAVVADEGSAVHVLRFATVIPQGTVWAREMQAFARDVADGSTNNQVQLKWYLGGIAGDDFEAASASSAISSTAWAPARGNARRWRRLPSS